MKKQNIFLALMLSVLFIGFSFQMPSQEDEVTATESVRVVNVEVPVRVFFKGEPVDNLARSDFKIFEDGKPQEINGFYIRKKKITGSGLPEKIIPDQPTADSRYFALAFKITQFDDKLRRGLDYLFKNVFREEDQCLVFINDRSLFFKNLSDMRNVRSVLDKTLLYESHKARRKLLEYLKKVEDELDFSRLQALMDRRDSRTAAEAIRFLQKYLLIWEDYNRHYIQPDIDNYYYFSRHLEKIRKEKWVINFYQIEMFPKLKPTGTAMEEIRDLIGGLQMSGSGEHVAQAQILISLLHSIDMKLHTSKDFPAEEISKLFYKVDATFHSVLMLVNQELLSEDLEYKRISTEIESSLAEITKRTGGSLQTTGNLEFALGKIQEKEDVTYMLTYSPSDPDKIGRIRVEVNNDQFRVLYDDQMRADYIKEYLRQKKLEVPDIQILNTQFKHKVLSMLVKNFLMSDKNEQVRKGRIYIEIQVVNADSETLYNQKKTIVADKEQVSLQINFPWMNQGRYHIIIHATDIQTGKTSSDFIQPVVL